MCSLKAPESVFMSHFQPRFSRTLMKDLKWCFCLWQQSSVQPICVRLSPGLAGSLAEEDAGGQWEPSLSEASLPEGDPHPGRGHPRLHMWRWASDGSFSAKCCKSSRKKTSIFGILRRIISCIIKHFNKSLSTPHQAFWFKPDMDTVSPSTFSASPSSSIPNLPLPQPEVTHIHILRRVWGGRHDLQVSNSSRRWHQPALSNMT